MKKRIFILLFVAALGILLCACNGIVQDDLNDDSGDTDREYNAMMFEVPEGGYDGSEVSISIGFVGYMGFLDKYIEEFNRLYPNIEIMVENSQEPEEIYERIIFTKGKWRPNIAFCLPDQVAEYRLAQWVVALDNLINHPEVGFSQEEVDDFVESFYNQGKEYGDGNIYSLPVGKQAEVLFYNKSFFDEHQLKVPTTWDEMEMICEQIKAIDPEAVPLGYELASNCFVTMSKQLGSAYTSATGENILFDNIENHNFTRKIQEWYKKGYLLIKSRDPRMDYGGVISPINQSLDITYQFASAVDNKCYMVIVPSSYASVLSPAPPIEGMPLFEVGVTMVPQYDVDNPKVISEGPDVCIMRDENPQEVMASWLFVKFLETNKEFQIEYALSQRYMPVLKSVATEADYVSRLENENGENREMVLAMKVCIEQQDAYFTLPAFPGSDDVYIEVGKILLNAVGKQEDVEDLFEQTIDDLRNRVE